VPINPRSSARIEEFITDLSKNGAHATHQSRSIYLINNIKTSVRTTTKTDQKIWFDVSETIIDTVDYFLYQTTSEHHFFLFPSQFFRHQYREMKDSNRAGAKIFYIDHKNKKLFSAESFSKDISDYYCSLLPDEASGNWRHVFLGEPDTTIAHETESTPELDAQVQEDLQAIAEENSLFEGGKSTKLTSYFERNSKLRAAAIAYHGLLCKGCGFSFNRAYGSHGENYIEVHHLVPVSTMLHPSSVNPQTDKQSQSSLIVV
jgi:predicted HNH restriction endonuclease